MHLLFATSLVACGAAESGYDIANHAIVSGLQRAGVKVTQIGFVWPGKSPSDPDNTIVLGEIDPKTDSADMRRKLEWLATAMRHGIAFTSAKLKHIGDETMRRALAKAGHFDGVVINGVALAGAFETALTAHPYIFVAHNVEHISARASADAASGLVERFMFAREARKLEALETRLADKARFTLTLSPDDRGPLGVADDRRSLALPLVMPEQSPPKGERTPAFDTGMIGTWTWAPNRIGLEWFLREVMPHMPAEASVAIAGKLPRGFPQRDKRVTFLGRVDDAREFVRQCRVVALASRAGTGVQLKTIETFEMGLPAVATSLSLRGIGSVPQNVRQEDNPKQYASALAAAIVAQRTGSLPDIDGTEFRKAQMVKMDAVLKAATAAIAAAG